MTRYILLCFMPLAKSNVEAGDIKMKLNFLICIVGCFLCGCSTTPEQTVKHNKYAIWGQCCIKNNVVSGTLYFVLDNTPQNICDLSLVPSPGKHIYKVPFVLKADNSLTYFWGDKLQKNSFENLPVNLPAIMSIPMKSRDMPLEAKAVCYIVLKEKNKNSDTIEISFWDNQCRKYINFACNSGMFTGNTPICLVKVTAVSQPPPKADIPVVKN